MIKHDVNDERIRNREKARPVTKKHLKKTCLFFLLTGFVLICGSLGGLADHKGKLHQQQQIIPEEGARKAAQTVDSARE